MGWLAWLIVIGGPIACATAGALVAWLFTWRHFQMRLDREYEAGWMAGQAWYPPEAGASPDAWQLPPGPAAQRPLHVAVAAIEALPALPAPSDEGGRHERTHSLAWRHDDLAALAGVRDEFDRIRQALGLPAGP